MYVPEWAILKAQDASTFLQQIDAAWQITLASGIVPEGDDMTYDRVVAWVKDTADPTVKTLTIMADIAENAAHAARPKRKSA